MTPLILLNTVGLTARLLPLAPRLQQLARDGWCRPLGEVVPAVTCTAQATMLTGTPARSHGIVGNGWLYRDTMEVRFWQQSNRLLQAEPIYQTLRRSAAERGRPFRCAKLFWWFNQGAAVAISVTPKPHYGADGNKVIGITGTPDGLTDRLERQLGPFPFHTFWGPLAGLPCTEWIARCAAAVLDQERPDLTLVYLPHLDYDPQRQSPSPCPLPPPLVPPLTRGGSRGGKMCDWPRIVGALDRACAPLLDSAKKCGARVWVVNEYHHVPVSRAVVPNRALRQAGLLQVRPGPFGEVLDTFASRAFAVCDHQLAHVYVNDPADVPRVCGLLAGLPGVGRALAGAERAALELDHPRSGEVILLAAADSWFAYPFWLDDTRAPDYARTVNIHAKPGYDPCELFFDPQLHWPKLRMLGRLAQKKLGFRTLFDVVPLDPALVRGSHGLVAATPEDRPILIGDGPAPAEGIMPLTGVHRLLGEALERQSGGR